MKVTIPVKNGIFLPILVLGLICLQFVIAEPQRQGRSIASSSGSSSNSAQNNLIEYGVPRALEKERKFVQDFMAPKNLVKSILKLIFGSPDEVSATSRSVINVISKVLDLVKNSFGQRSRSGSGRANLRDWAEEAATAGVSMLQGYVKSVLATNDNCVKRYLCEASRQARTEGRDAGYLIASVGGYATSYLLDANKSASAGFKQLHDAAVKGRSLPQGQTCADFYECSEA